MMLRGAFKKRLFNVCLTNISLFSNTCTPSRCRGTACRAPTTNDRQRSIRPGFTLLRPAGLRGGFTLVELIIVISIFAVCSAVTLPFLARFQQSQNLDTLRQGIASTMRRAQQRAVAGERDSAWGVHVGTGTYILYSGSSYAARTTALDEQHSVATVFTFSGLSDVLFRKVWGSAMTGGTLTIGQGSAGTKTIQVTTAGAITLP